MGQTFFIMMIAAMAAVLVSLFVGLFYMGKGGEDAKKKSQKAMRMRVLLQGVALLFFVLAALTIKK